MTAWISEEQKVICFHEVADFEMFCSEEQSFWKHIMELTSLGYRLF